MKGRQKFRGMRALMLGLVLTLPLCMGGCPEFRNESVDAIETASRGLIDAALNLFFEQLRTDRTS